MKQVKRASIREVPDNANIITSHSVYMIKVEEEDAPRLKFHIALQGNEELLKFEWKF